MYMDAAILRLLGDETRLRLLRLLSREALNVSELTAVLGVAQSGVSRHLGLLREARARGRGTNRAAFSWYRLPAATNGRSRRARAALGVAARGIHARTPATRADDARLEEVRRLRKENFRSTHGDDRRQLVPGRSWAAWSRALGLLLPALDVADLGCGEGYLTIETARWARRVIAVDRSADVLARGRELAKRRKLANITWKRGELERLPIEDAVGRSRAAVAGAAPRRASGASRSSRRAAFSVRAAACSFSIFASTTSLGAREARRSLARLQRRRAARRCWSDAGFVDVTVRVGARRSGDPFTVLIAAGTKADAKDDPEP